MYNMQHRWYCVILSALVLTRNQRTTDGHNSVNNVTASTAQPSQLWKRCNAW